MDGKSAFLDYLKSLDSKDYSFISANILGKIPAPYSKSAINDSLIAFFSDKDNLFGIFSSLDQTDIRMLSCIHLLGSASYSDLHDLCRSDSLEEIQSRMHNLISRLVVIQKNGLLYMNPLLEVGFFQGIEDLDLMLGEDRSTQVRQKTIDRNMVMAIMNLYISSRVPAREANFHHFEKSGRLDSVFPQFDHEQILSIFKAVSIMLKNTGALYFEDATFHLNMDKVKRILKMDSFSLCLHTLTANQGENAQLVCDAIHRILGILRHHSLNKMQASVIMGILCKGHEIDSNKIINDMIDIGLITMKGKDISMNAFVFEDQESRSELTMDSNLSVSFFGQSLQDDILFLFADVQVCDNMVTYQITKESFSRALGMGYSRLDLESYLKTSDIAEFENWESSKNRVRAFEGVLIECTDDQSSSIVELHPEIKGHIILKVDKRHFLMDKSTSEVWTKVLSDALDMMSITIEDTKKKEEDRATTLEILNIKDYKYDPQDPDKGKIQPCWESVQEKLYNKANELGIMKPEVKALIDSRLIVSEKQLDKDFSYSALTSVSGFDFNAKLVLLKDTVKARNAIVILEISDELVVARPIEVIKGNTSSSLRFVTIPDSEERIASIPSIFKISVVRKV